MSIRFGKQSHEPYMPELAAGIDIGSATIDAVIVDRSHDVIYRNEPVMHFGNIRDALKEVWSGFPQGIIGQKRTAIAFTGEPLQSPGLLIDDCISIPESIAIPTGASIILPQAEYVFHIGAKNSYFFHVGLIDGNFTIKQWRSSSRCGSGAGILIEKQCRRLYSDEVALPTERETKGTGKNDPPSRKCQQARLERVLELAESETASSTSSGMFKGRCGVVLQTDLIHRQNEGAVKHDNLACLYRTIAGNYVSDVLSGVVLADGVKATITGGVGSSRFFVRQLEDACRIQLIRSQYGRPIAAIGAAVLALNEEKHGVVDHGCTVVPANHRAGKRSFAPSLQKQLENVTIGETESFRDIVNIQDAVIGIDGGSTTTKAVLVDVDSCTLLDKIYVHTAGDPEKALQTVLSYLAKHRHKVTIKGVGATGSARKLYEKLLLSPGKQKEYRQSSINLTDKSTDEISCHALGVRQNCRGLGAIYEIGGQDMKYTSFNKDGSVREARMNHSCQAGCGQTMENLAALIGLDVRDSLQEAALRAERVPIIDFTCGVFMEMEVNDLISNGFSREEVAAAIVRGTAASYYFKFVGGTEQVGGICSAQGGPSLGKAFLAALSQVSGRHIHAFPHREVFGAFGQALDVIDTIREFDRKKISHDTAFRGWDFSTAKFLKNRTTCSREFGGKSCRVRDCDLSIYSLNSEKVIAGGNCPVGNPNSSGRGKKNYVSLFHSILEKNFRAYGLVLRSDERSVQSLAGVPDSIGIKRSTATFGDKAVWSAALLESLGFTPVLSPVTTEEIARRGIALSRTEYCIAAKIAAGHGAFLRDYPGLDYLYAPGIISSRDGAGNSLKYCIYTESEGYVQQSRLSIGQHRLFKPIIHFGSADLIIDSMYRELRRLGFAASRRAIRMALERAEEARLSFLRDISIFGDSFLDNLTTFQRPGYIGIGRDYVLMDPAASAHSGVLFSQICNIDYLPQTFIEHRFGSIDIGKFVENEYWAETVNILKAHRFIGNRSNLFGVRMMNFGCGPDSVKIYQERRLQDRAGKPFLELMIDGQDSHAPFATRIEAHQRVVERFLEKRGPVTQLRDHSVPKKTYRKGKENQTWLIPFMGNASYAAAAALNHIGVDAVVLPTHTQKGNAIARKHLSTEVCQPLKTVVGDVLAFFPHCRTIEEHNKLAEKYLVMLPTTSGPCRFGKYVEVLQSVMEKEGREGITIAGPTSTTDYLDVPLPEKISKKERKNFQKILFSGILATDLLEDVFRACRPYIKDKAAIEKLRDECLVNLRNVIQVTPDIDSLHSWAVQTAVAFAELHAMKKHKLPMVLYTGEIYMRQHDGCTGNLLDRLEDSGLELVREPVVTWLSYINGLATMKSRANFGLCLQSRRASGAGRSVLQFCNSRLKKAWMLRVGKTLFEPFRSIIGNRHFLPGPLELISLMQKEGEMHIDIEGESSLSIGTALYMMRNLDARRFPAGIVHIGPFTCMQETVAMAKIEGILATFRKQQPERLFPIMHIFPGDTVNTNLDNEIAVFSEQCRQNQRLVSSSEHGENAQPCKQ